MHYRERRQQKKSYSRQRDSAAMLALLSGQGAGLFLCLVTPLQLIGRATPHFVGLAMLAGAGLGALFAWGIMQAWNALAFDGEGQRKLSEEAGREAMFAAVRGMLIIIGLLGFTGLLMFSEDFRRFAFAEAAADIGAGPAAASP